MTNKNSIEIVLNTSGHNVDEGVGATMKETFCIMLVGGGSRMTGFAASKATGALAIKDVGLELLTVLSVIKGLDLEPSMDFIGGPGLSSPTFLGGEIALERNIRSGDICLSPSRVREE